MSDASNRKSPTHEEISVRAYEIFEERGSIPGDDVSNWLEAEAELSRAVELEAEAQSETRNKPEAKYVDSPISAPAVSGGLRSRATVA
jgi:hypothetical protein